MLSFCAAILILTMEENKGHFQHIMLYYFKKGKNATEMQEKKKICGVYGKGSVTDQTCQKWFVKFCAGHSSLDNAPRWGRPVEVDSDQIETLIENSQHYTMQEDSQHTQNIQIHKIIGENKKMCLLVYRKN